MRRKLGLCREAFTIKELCVHEEDCLLEIKKCEVIRSHTDSMDFLSLFDEKSKRSFVQDK